MRRRDEGWDDGRRDWGNDGGWPDGPGGGSYGGDRGDGRANGQGYGRPDYPAYPGPGSQETAAEGWDRSARDDSPAGYAGRVNGGQASGQAGDELTRVDAGFGDSAPNGRGYSGDGYRPQANFTPSFRPSAAPAEFSPAEAPPPERPGGRPGVRAGYARICHSRGAEGANAAHHLRDLPRPGGI
jgi:hypothetical protein